MEKNLLKIEKIVKTFLIFDKIFFKIGILLYDFMAHINKIHKRIMGCNLWPLEYCVNMVAISMKKSHFHPVCQVKEFSLFKIDLFYSLN